MVSSNPILVPVTLLTRANISMFVKYFVTHNDFHLRVIFRSKVSSEFKRIIVIRILIIT